MSRPIPQFKAHIKVTLEETNLGGRGVFGFGDDGNWRVPMQMEGVEGLHTVGLWIGGGAQFKEGDEFDADCCLLWPEGFVNVVQAGKKIKLWDGGFFADGVVTERVEEGWKL